jgi:hypothetical protein
MKINAIKLVIFSSLAIRIYETTVQKSALFLPVRSQRHTSSCTPPNTFQHNNHAWRNSLLTHFSSLTHAFRTHFRLGEQNHRANEEVATQYAGMSEMEIDFCIEKPYILTTPDCCSAFLIRSPRPDICVAMVTETTQLSHSLPSATRRQDSAHLNAYVMLTYLPNNAVEVVYSLQFCRRIFNQNYNRN